MKIKQKDHSKKKIIIIAAATLLVVIASYTVVARLNNLWPFPDDNKNSQTSQNGDDPSNIDLMPATDEQKESGYRDKENTVNSQSEASKDNQATQNPSTPSTNSGTKQAVGVTVTNYSVANNVLHVNAMVDTLTAGKCTATVTKGGTTLGTKTGDTFTQSSYVSCADLDIQSVSGFKGDVTITVKYTNDTQEGTVSINASL